MIDPTAILIGILLTGVALGLAHMATESRSARRAMQAQADRIAQEFAALRPAPRPTVEDDWHRPDVVIGLDKRGRLLTQEIEA